MTDMRFSKFLKSKRDPNTIIDDPELRIHDAVIQIIKNRDKTIQINKDELLDKIEEYLEEQKNKNVLVFHSVDYDSIVFQGFSFGPCKIQLNWETLDGIS